MNYLRMLQKKLLQTEQKVKQRTHAIDQLVSGQTAANQRSIANTKAIRELRAMIKDTQSIMIDTNIDNRLKFRSIANEAQKNKRTILWLKAWLLGLTLFNVIMMVAITIYMLTQEVQVL